MNDHHCQKCNTNYQDHVSLGWHVHKKHNGNWYGIEPAKSEKETGCGCAICGAEFATKVGMMQHLIVHRTDGRASKAQIMAVLDKEFERLEMPLDVAPVYMIQEEP